MIPGPRPKSTAGCARAAPAPAGPGSAIFSGGGWSPATPARRNTWRPGKNAPVETRAPCRRLFCMSAARLRLVRPALAVLLGMAALASAAPPPGKTESSEGTFVFSFLPKSFSKNPLVDQTVITEMTEEGKKLPPVSPDHPVYYAAQSGGYRTIAGQDAAAAQPPTTAEVELAMQRALAVNGYRPVAAGQPAGLLIVYTWGEHNNLDAGSTEIADTAFLDAGHSNLLSRAALVGGARFAAELKHALEQQASQDEAYAAMRPEFTQSLGDYGPMRAFTERDAKTRQLYEECLAPCYYVVVSAYDYAAAAQGRRKLLWRSKLTVEATGVSMTDTLPMLIANGARYLGRDMPEAATMTKPINREGHTTLGPLKVEEYLEKPAAPAERKP